MTNPHRDEDRVRGLLQESVSDVDPDHRLDEIRRRIHRSTTPDRTKVTPMPATPTRRPWVLGALGAAVATAAVIGVVAVVTDGPDSPAPTAGSTPSGPTTAADPSASTEPSSEPSASTQAMAVYYVGDGPRGPRLFREFHRVAPADAVAEAAEAPLDPDYRTDWKPGDVESSSEAGSVIRVAMADTSLSARPAGMSAPEAAMALQSLVYTAQAAYQSRDAVQFTVGDVPLPSLYGVPLEGAVKAASAIRTLSLMSITAPEEGQRVSGTLEASGVSNGFEANVSWQLKDGDAVVKQGFTTAEGWMGDRLFPWKASVPLAGVPAGTYTFVASTDDPSGGEGGGGVDTDTRTVVIE